MPVLSQLQIRSGLAPSVAPDLPVRIAPPLLQRLWGPGTRAMTLPWAIYLSPVAYEGALAGDDSALVAHEAVAEAAVVGYPHEIKGTGIFAYVDLVPDFQDTNPDQIIGALKQQVRHAIGPIASPDEIQIVTGLPKTRSGKIMRRILRNIAHGEYEDLGDITTLADPGVVERLVDDHKSAHGG